MAVSALACLSCCTANAAIFFHGATDGSGTKRIRIEGEISDGDANRFAEFVRRENANEHTIFHLNSPGGSVLEAERIASKIHRLGASVSVDTGDTCASACFLMFSAGVTRYAGKNSFIGVHSASVNGKETPASLAVTTLIARDAAAYGVPASVVGKIVTTMPGQITWLSSADLGAMHVVVEQTKVPSQVAGSSAEFKGNYVCAQGVTRLGLRILDAPRDGKTIAVFSFGSTYENPDVPSGAFQVEGKVDGGTISLSPVAWIARPTPYYVMVGLTDHLAMEGNHFPAAYLGINAVASIWRGLGSAFRTTPWLNPDKGRD